MKLGFFRIDKLNFVEFNITGDDLNYHRLNEESYFLASEVFNLFAHCFERSNELYEYYEPSKYNARKIVVLRNELLSNHKLLSNITTESDFICHLENIFLGKAFFMELEVTDPHWKNHWQAYVEKLKEVNKEMLSIVDKCIEEVRILWIIGY
jgi:hypothetical protein